ncbi:PD-(D/E)XK nuclease family protein [Flavobacterium sp. NRK F7]|uniref:PD-(D/E)XK nuclease family protein n=1 Tax=Flavobacterium sp. NRK F7 TaxID=2954930 RepID=UPI002090A57E|nr:PD-(D/E)XK nuclease family protein [Flavobacterium sp. NRK F7]MCO6161543.1 PD-(D/E)XK nuclease family protein [Flavobacterium sp. NRK F7]
MNDTFLDKLSKHILAQYKDHLQEIIIVLPNKRAKVFLLDALHNHTNQTIFAPQIISIEDLIQEISGIRSIDAIEILFEFYDIYTKITPLEEVQPFTTFSNWAKTLLQDFNEIDRYLLDPNFVFSYLKDIEALKRWDLQPKDTTSLIDNNLLFWKKIPEYYTSLYTHLKNKKCGYQGLIYRESIALLKDYSNKINNKKLIFAGFNALNQAEEKIILHLISNEQASIYWDIDAHFISNPYHDAGLFIRRFKNQWKNYVTQPFEWISEDFQQEKNIQIIGTPKTIGQAKITGKIVEEIISIDSNSTKTAIILGDENLLIPILYALPNSVNALNITMGYSGKNNPAQLLISKLFKLHTNAVNRNASHYTLYYKEVLEILNHPLVEPYLQVDELIQTIHNNNFTFFSIETLFRLKEEKYPNQKNTFFDLIFLKWENDPISILNRISNILVSIKSFLNNENEEEKISKTFVYALYKVINQLINYCDKHANKINDTETLYDIYKQIIDLAEVSFEGEPLTGLQIMGVLESRVLDFENIIITSVNEGKFPSGKSQNSFIPYDVKRELGLPTYKEKDAIYSYHFYHLLHRAKNIYLLYNSDNEGIDAGEKSRFITQLEIEKQPKHILSHKIYNAVLPEKAYNAVQVPKSDLLMERLQEIATEKGFSPSSLTSYIRNPIQFYFQRVLRINEMDEVEENIAVNTLGTIIHEVLEVLYYPYLNKYLSIKDIEEMLLKIDAITLEKFKLVYKEGEIKKGKNLLAFEVAKRNIYNFLQVEKNTVEAGEAVKIIALEEKIETLLEDERLPYPIKIAGNVDRIELRGNVIRIIDYKTGKVDGNALKINDFEALTSDIKNEKIIQLLCYALMFRNKPEYDSYPIEAGIISFKNMKAGFMPFGLGKGRGVIPQTMITNEMLEAFKTEIISLILEILNQQKPLKESI